MVKKGVKKAAGHILLVEDEESIRTTLPPILSERGFAVTAVGSISEALAKVNEAKFDALVSDLNVEKPGDGFLVVAAMHLFQPKCVNVVLTGWHSIRRWRAFDIRSPIISSSRWKSKIW